MFKKAITLFAIPILFFAKPSLAHCPLCTVGAGAAAAGAAWLGVSAMTIGVYVGAFALAMGLWMPRLIKKEYLPHQQKLIAGLIFASTVLPLLPLMKDYSSFYISIAGDYGTLLNRTYLLNRFLMGIALGAAALFLAPFISKKMARIRKNKTVPYQGIIITFSLLAIISVIIELLI